MTDPKNGKTNGLFISGTVTSVKPTRQGNFMIAIAAGDQMFKVLATSKHGWEEGKHYDAVPVNAFAIKEPFIGKLAE